jgi:thymidylate kinase
MISYVLEGQDGSGKSTLAQRLCKQINSEIPNLYALTVDEPGDLIVGLRRLFLHSETQSFTGFGQESVTLTSEFEKPAVTAAVALALASQAQTAHVLRVAEGALSASGRSLVVFHDRSILSTLVYQGFSRSNPRTMVQRIWNAYVNLVQEQHDGVILLSGCVRTSDSTESDHYDRTGISTKIARLYTDLEYLLLGDLAHLRHYPDHILTEMRTLLGHSSVVEFKNRFPNWQRYSTADHTAANLSELVFNKLVTNHGWISAQ